MATLYLTRRLLAPLTLVLAALFFAIVVIQVLGADKPALRGADQPFLAVVKIGGFADRVVRYDVENKVLGTVADELMEFVRLEDESVALFDRRRSILVPDGTFQPAITTGMTTAPVTIAAGMDGNMRMRSNKFVEGAP